MASQPQPLCPAVPCASTTGTGLVTGSPEKGAARPKPPVRPKPRVLPKPAVPTKPTLPPPVPGLRHPRPELPSAEKMNRLAGPQPYGGGSAGGALRRPSFTIRSPETPSGKGLPSPPVAAVEDPAPGEEVPPAPLTPSRKGPAPFKVTPVPVATKPERFPGTTVEEILAKMDSREGPGNPDRGRLSPFCSDPSSRFVSKTFAAFRRRPSGEADGVPPGDTPHAPQPVGKLGTGADGQLVTETSGSPPAGPRCAGDPRGRRRPPSPPDLSALQPGTLGPPGSPRPPTCPAPGAPFHPAEPSASAPGSPDAPLELPAPGSPTLAPSSTESPVQPPAEVSIPAPGAPSSTAEPRLSASRSPGSPHTPGEGSPGTASPPSTPELPPRVTCPPGSPEAATQYPAPSSPPPVKASCPPGSPEGPDDSPVSSQPPEGTVPTSRDSGLRRSSEGVLQSPTVGQGLGVLGGSLSTLPRPGDPLPELTLGSESGWSLSQSFEWTFPARGLRQPVSPPRSPILEVASSGVSEEEEEPAPSPPRSQGDSSSEGAPCPGGPVAQREAEGSAEEEEEEGKGEAEWGATMPCSPLCVTEPAQDPAEPESPTSGAPQDPATVACLESARLPGGECPVSLQGPGGPCHAEEPSGRNPHADPGWLTELLASPGVHAAGHRSPDTEGSEDLLGWSRKDLRSEFGVGSAHQAGAFSWSREAVARERDWSGETEQDRAFGTTSSWDSRCRSRDREQPDRPFGTARGDWGSGYGGTELEGEARLGCSNWPESRGMGEGCQQDRDFGAGKPKWGTGYFVGSTGSREIGAGQADWSMGCGQQRDEEPSWASRYSPGDPESRDGEVAPTWDGGYGTDGAEMKDKELTPNWASEYSSRDAKDKDFTLGWAGRSSTGDTGSPEKEFSPSRPGWHSQYSTRDMESQDREFSPSRPASDDRHSTRDKESQHRDMESRDREFKPSRPAWDDEHSTSDVENQNPEFSVGQLAEGSKFGSRDMKTWDKEFKPSKATWDDRYSIGDVETWDRDMESQDQEFSPSRLAWASEHSSRAMETQDSRLKPSRPVWDDVRSSRDTKTRDVDVENQDQDTESQEQEFSPRQPGWASEHSTRDMETQDGELSPSRLTWAGEHSSREVEAQDSRFSPSSLVWHDRYSARDMETWDRDMESQDQEFSPSRPAWDDRYSTRDMESQDRDVETQDQEFSSGRPVWDDRYSTRDVEAQDRDEEMWDRDMESQDREFSPGWPPCASGPSSTSTGKEGGEFGPGQLSWASEHSIGQPELGDAFGVGQGNSPGSRAPDLPAQEPGWGGAHCQECGATGSRDWAEELGGAQCHDQFGVIGTEPVPDPSSAGASPDASMSWAGGMGSGGQTEYLGDWHGELSFGTSGATGHLGTGDASGVGPDQAWGEDLGSESRVEDRGWSGGVVAADRSDAEAKRREWASAFGARCAARSRDFGDGEQNSGGGTSLAEGSIHLLDPSLPTADALAAPQAVESPRSEPPGPTEEERDTAEPLLSPGASPLLLEAASRTLPGTESEGPHLDHPDGERPPSREEKQVSLRAPQPEGPTDPTGQEFTFLEDTEVLDSSVYRSKASLGRKRRHRAPALRPVASAEGDAWIFRDSTEPRPTHPAASDEDEEAAEGPKSRRVRSSPLGRGVKVPLFPGLSTAALKAKLRGRNRSAEEGTAPGDSKGPPTKDPHVQRSKSCKIPGLSGKPPALPPKPEKSSGSEASPPHWLQALKLKKKKP